MVTAEHETPATSSQAHQEVAQVPRSIGIASRGIRTSRDAANFLSALVSDVASETMKPKVASVCVNGIGKLLKVVEMQQKYGTPDGQGHVLELADPDVGVDNKSKRRAELERELALLS
jgi:hypothetical protein